MFEFDSAKSDANKEKHGVDFIEAQQLWQDPRRIRAQARTDDEERWMTLGAIDGVVWAAIYTFRNENIRLISVRRARQNEVKIYENEK